MNDAVRELRDAGGDGWDQVGDVEHELRMIRRNPVAEELDAYLVTEIKACRAAITEAKRAKSVNAHAHWRCEVLIEVLNRLRSIHEKYVVCGNQGTDSSGDEDGDAS